MSKRQVRADIQQLYHRVVCPESEVLVWVDLPPLALKEAYHVDGKMLSAAEFEEWCRQRPNTRVTLVSFKE
jgi:hypothetical protein